MRSTKAVPPIRPLLKGALFIFLFSVISSLLFSNAQLLTVLGIFLGSLYVGKSIKKKEIFYGLIAPLPALVVLQLFYYQDIGRYFSPRVFFLLVFFNFLLASTCGGLAGLSAALLNKGGFRKKVIGKWLAAVVLVVYSTSLALGIKPVWAEEDEIETIEEFVENYDPAHQYILETQLLPPKDLTEIPQEIYKEYPDIERGVINFYWEYCQQQNHCDFKTTLEGLMRDPPEELGIGTRGWLFIGDFYERVSGGILVIQNFYNHIKTITKVKATDGLGTRILKNEIRFFLGVGEGVVNNLFGMTPVVAKFVNWAGTTLAYSLYHPRESLAALKKAVSVGVGIGKILTADYASYQKQLLRDSARRPQNIFLLLNPPVALGSVLLHKIDDAYPGGTDRLLADVIFSPEAMAALAEGDWGYALGRGGTEAGFLVAGTLKATNSVSKIEKIPTIGPPFGELTEKLDDIDGAFDVIKVASRRYPETELTFKRTAASLVSEEGGESLAMTLEEESHVFRVKDQGRFGGFKMTLKEESFAKVNFRLINEGVDEEDIRQTMVGLFARGRNYTKLYEALDNSAYEAETIQTILEVVGTDPTLSQLVSDESNYESLVAVFKEYYKVAQIPAEEGSVLGRAAVLTKPEVAKIVKGLKDDYEKNNE